MGTAAPAAAHSRWILPSHTVLSGAPEPGDEPPLVSCDVSVSNDIFHVDRAFGVGRRVGPAAAANTAAPPTARVRRPDGTWSEPLELIAAGRKSVVAVPIDRAGTHRIEISTPPRSMTTWSLPDGGSEDSDGRLRRGRAFGSRSEVTLPEGATDVVTRRMHSRLVTWVTLDAPTALVAQVDGLDLQGPSPGDLFATEATSWTLTVDGRPVPAGVEVQLTRDGTRHRDDRETLTATTDDEGRFTVTLPVAGYYLLEAEIDRPSEAPGIDREVASLFATLEAQAP